jgi:hypothetical protein
VGAFIAIYRHLSPFIAIFVAIYRNFITFVAIFSHLSPFIAIFVAIFVAFCKRWLVNVGAIYWARFFH